MNRLMIAFAALALCAVPACAAVTEVSIAEANPQPESITMAPDGSLILGSLTHPHLYRTKPGGGEAQVWIDVSADGPNVSFLGVMADAPTNTLWACQYTSFPGTPRRLSQLRAFDLKTGAAKLRWALPGDSNNCNDFAIAADHTVYFTDTFNGRIFRLKPGAAAPEMWTEDKMLYGIDGITLLDGVLYANTVWSDNIYRVPMDATGKALAPVDLWLSQQVASPDGMRAAHGKLFLAENRSGKVDMVTIEGDKAIITTLKTGYAAPTAVEPVGDTLWVGDRTGNKAFALVIPK